MSLNDLFSTLKGGPGSGNFNHGGIPGKRGGSTPGGGGGFNSSLYESRKTSMTNHFKREASKVKNSIEEGRTAKGDELNKWNKEKVNLQKQVSNPSSEGNAEDAKAGIDLIDEYVIPAIESAKVSGIPKTAMPQVSDRERRDLIRGLTGKKR